jgi:D-tagatose-1,6-bisphosphate aldolase subunit GatZ/KbaZ
MYLDEILAAQKQGEARGVTSICSAHPYVLKQTLRSFKHPLIEATCNQVNQYGGYTGMTPKDFVHYIRGIADENNFPIEGLILGGDHLGPSVWQDEPAEAAMDKAEAMVSDYVEAGFVKIHLDCSMRLADDPQGALDVEVSAKRAARLARVAESMGQKNLRYVIGTEVPIAGGAMEHEERVKVTRVEDVRLTIGITRQAFYRAGLQSAWERVIAVVVQPGVEFGDDFVLPYQSDLAKELSLFVESQSLIYEVHSTDYQTPSALRDLVSDHFAILKVGPALTFAFREAALALADIEDELFPTSERSNLASVLEQTMLEHPAYWARYYHGSEEEKAFKRKYSLSDRIRYFWVYPTVERAFAKMMHNLSCLPLPDSLLQQYFPDVSSLTSPSRSLSPDFLLLSKIQLVLDSYILACKS